MYTECTQSRMDHDCLKKQTMYPDHYIPLLFTPFFREL